MADIPPISDDEVLLRHVPPGTTWQAPGPRLTSANFRPRARLAETAISVNRLMFTTPERLMQLVGGDPGAGSRIAWATAGEVRSLGFRVEPRPILPDDPGHSQIESTDAASLESKTGPKLLAALFRFADLNPLPVADTNPGPDS
jgi:hypothetical protein